MANGKSWRSSTIRWGALVALVAAGLGVGALVAAAYEHASPNENPGTPAPVPTFTLGVATPTPTPTTTAFTAAPRDSERFLAVGTGTGSNVWWRGVAGACGGTAPLIERSTDGGATWTDVTPLDAGATQLASLDAFAQTEAEIVVGGGSNCVPQALRTFTQGQFWEPYPDVLAASRFVSPSDAASVQLPSGPLSAPCSSARSLRARGDVVALICDSTAYVAAGGEWVALPAPDAAALNVAGDSVLVAYIAPECSGLSLTSFASADLAQAVPTRCAEGVDPTQPIAITSTPSGTLVWSGETIAVIE